MQISMRNLFHNYFFKSILTSYTEVVPNRKVRDFFLSLNLNKYIYIFFPPNNIVHKHIEENYSMKWGKITIHFFHLLKNEQYHLIFFI